MKQGQTVRNNGTQSFEPKTLARNTTVQRKIGHELISAYGERSIFIGKLSHISD